MKIQKYVNQIMLSLEKKRLWIFLLIAGTFYDIFHLSDIYLIRRILDKKYNKKKYFYTGL